MTTRETYDLTREHWTYLRDAYLGGRYWHAPSATTIASARLTWSVQGAVDETGRPVLSSAVALSYLVPHDGESDTKFAKRCALASYVNIVAPVVKAYADGVTQGIQRDLTPIAEFVDDVDRSGSSWGEVTEQVATWAATYGVVATIVDAPSVDVSSLSEAQRRERRIQPYVVTVHPSAWVAVESHEGRITLFAYVSTPYRSDLSSDSTADVEVRVWRATTAEQPGGWEVRRGSVSRRNSIGDQIEGLPLVASGPLPAVLAGEIPVTFAFYERETSSECPMGVSLVSDVADAARSIFNRLSWIDEIDRNAAFPFLAIPLASTGGQLDDAATRKVGTSNALGYNSASGVPSWIEPSGNSQRVMREQVVFAFQWAMRCAGLELAADQSAQVQSGEALRIRSRDFESRAKRFARNLQRWETATLRLLALMAGRGDAELRVTYPKRITLSDPLEDLQRALQLLSAPVEIGTIARREAVKQLADSALSLDDARLSEVSDEIDAIYSEDLATSSAELAVKRLRAQNEVTGLQQVVDNASNPAPVDTSPVAAPVPTDTAAVADTALNGAQVGSLLEIITAVAAGTLPVDTARAIIGEAFPTFDATKIDAMLLPLRNRPATAPQAPAAPVASASAQPAVSDGVPA